MFDQMRVRSKLSVALAIPLAALVVLSAVTIAASRNRADEATGQARAIHRQVELATASIGPSGVITALTNERTAEFIGQLGVGQAVGSGAGDSLYGAADRRQATDAAVENFKAAVADKSPEVRAAYRAAFDQLAHLGQVRREIDAYGGERNLTNSGGAQRAFDGYSRLIDALLAANSRIALTIDDTELRATARVIDQLTHYRDNQTVRVYVASMTLLHPGTTALTQDLAALRRSVGLQRRNDDLIADMLSGGDPALVRLVRDMLTAGPVAAIRAQLDDAVAGVAQQALAYATPDVTAVGTITLSTIESASARLQSTADRLQRAAKEEAAAAAGRARLVVWLTMLVLLVAVAVTLSVSRSVTRPLARLVHDAETMATSRLPATVQGILDLPLGEDVEIPSLADIDARGGREIAEVASALNTVQTSAAGLAVEQAVLRRHIADAFVSLGRRNQNLLGRLLEHVTDMERNEVDPDHLQKLFVVDHLATRLRRNAESLLVLAGISPKRQWSEPVPVVDVVRGALGEVEGYRRVRVEAVDDVAVDGTHAADISHLLAELLENALTNSPPDQPVVVRGIAHEGRYRLAIIDRGTGMPPHDLAVANARLGGHESFTVAPSRYLGHYVVGLHAARLGLGIGLRETPGGRGLTAVVELTAVVRSGPSSTAVRAEDVGLLRAAAVPERGDGSEQGDGVEDPASTEPASPGSTDTTSISGYRRRIRGAHLPVTEIVAAIAVSSDIEPADTADDAPETLRAALNGMRSGLSRSRTTVQPDDTTDHEEQAP